MILSICEIGNAAPPEYAHIKSLNLSQVKEMLPAYGNVGNCNISFKPVPGKPGVTAITVEESSSKTKASIEFDPSSKNFVQRNFMNEHRSEILSYNRFAAFDTKADPDGGSRVGWIDFWNPSSDHNGVTSSNSHLKLYFDNSTNKVIGMSFEKVDTSVAAAVNYKKQDLVTALYCGKVGDTIEWAKKLYNDKTKDTVTIPLALPPDSSAGGTAH